MIWLAADAGELDAVSTHRAAFVSLFAASSFALVACMTYSGRALARWAVLSAGLACVVAAVAVSVTAELPAADQPFEGDEARLWWWALGSFVFLYVSVPFAQIFQQSGQPRFPYPELFRHSWNNFFIGIVAAVFVGLGWALVGLWGGLFKAVGISFFADLFGSKPFAWCWTFTLFGFGLALGRESEAVIATLRRVTLKMAQVLLPFVAGVALLFCLTLPFTGLAPLWKTGDATPLVLCLMASFTLFLNGVFEEGERTPAFPGWLLTGLRVAIVTLPIFSGIALFGTSLRVAQYGLTPERVFALVFTSIASLYAVGYACAALWPRGRWMQLLPRINVATALVLAATAILIQLPVLDPMRLSAENQLSRLREGRIAASDFDYATLRFRLGHRGWEALEALAGAREHAEFEIIRDEIAKVKAATAFWQARDARTTPLAFSVSPADLQVPPGLGAYLASVYLRHDCKIESDCLLISADFDSDGTREYCLLIGRQIGEASFCVATAGDRFARVGHLSYRGTGPAPPLSDLRKTTPTQLRRSRYEDLVLPGGEGVLQLVP